MDYVAEQIKYNLTDPPFWLQIGAFWIVVNAINAMPMPDQNSGKFYAWLHTFLTSMAGNISRAAAKKGIPADTVSVTQIKTTTVVEPSADSVKKDK